MTDFVYPTKYPGEVFRKPVMNTRITSRKGEKKQFQVWMVEIGVGDRKFYRVSYQEVRDNVLVGPLVVTSESKRTAGFASFRQTIGSLYKGWAPTLHGDGLRTPGSVTESGVRQKNREKRIEEAKDGARRIAERQKRTIERELKDLEEISHLPHFGMF